MYVTEKIREFVKRFVRIDYEKDFLYDIMLVNYGRLRVLALLLWGMEFLLFFGFTEVDFPREPQGLFLLFGLVFLPLILRYTKNVYDINYKMLQLVLYFYMFTVILLGIHISIYQYGEESMYILVMVMMAISSSVSIKPKNLAIILLMSYIVFSMYSLLLDVTQSDIMVLRINILILHIFAWVINKFVIDLKYENYLIQKELEEKNAFLEKVAKKDSMTKLYNHDNSIRLLNESIEEVRKEKKPLSVCLLDLDNFKNINDTYGHQIGDKVINRVAEEIRNCVRVEDIVGRYGGEEFIIIFKGLDKKAAFKVIDRIREEVEILKFENKFNITFSAGISDISETIDSEELIRLADVRLYKIKRSTKNAIAID